MHIWLARWKSGLLWSVAVVAGVVFIGMAGWGSWQLIDATTPSAEPASGSASGNVEAVRTALTAMVGAGGLVTLLVVIRRQWSQEQDHKLARQVAVDNRHDAEERRITELYMAAAGQLGHDKAPVRLAALHALDRLGQNHPSHRQVVADIWCSYLRQPFTPPTRFSTGPQDGDAAQPQVEFPVDAYLTSSEAAVDLTVDQEYEVRATAQRLLVGHLTDSRLWDDRTDEPPPVEPGGYWQLTSIDLTGAILIDASFRNCWFPQVSFDGTRFCGDATFTGARFSGGSTLFGEARFDVGAWFDGARFDGYAWFDEALFGGDAQFNGARFDQVAFFEKVQFLGEAEFHKARLGRYTTFVEARFNEGFWFRDIGLEEGAKLNLSRAIASTKPFLIRDWPIGWRATQDPELGPGWCRLEEDPEAPD